MEKKRSIFIIILFTIVIMLLSVILFCIKTDGITNIKNTKLAPYNTAKKMEEDSSKYSYAYKKWLELSDEEKAKIGVIPRKYDVPLDMVYERMEQENSVGKRLKNIFNLGDINEEVLPNSFILTGEDTNKNGITDENDIKVESYGGLNIRVENQESEGLCWAFASIKSLETNLALNYNVEYDFSERHLDYMKSVLIRDGGRDQGSGGNFDKDFESYINAEDGPVFETEVPYHSKYTTISELEYLESLLQKVDVDEDDFVHMPSINKSTTSYTDMELKTFKTIVKEHLINNGSLYASIYADAIVDDIENKNRVLNYQGDSGTNHAISIIGWDDNFSKENFPESCRPNNDGAYIALNSWGEDWGNCGLFYISYEDKWIETNMNGVRNAKILDLLSIYIEKEPNNLNYCTGDTFNAEGMVVKGIYQNEEKEIKEYTITPEEITANTEFITISYTDTEKNTTKTTKQKINLYDVKESIGNEANLYYDNINKVMFISGNGIPQIDFANYDLKLMVLDEGIKGIEVNDSLSQLNNIYILDKECEITNINISENATVYCHKDSTAQEYCQTNNINYYSYDNYYKCGEKAYAFLNKTNNSLIISGVGEVYKYTLSEIPWRKENENIEFVKIDNEITKVPDKLFAENSNIEKVELGNDITKIGDYAFKDCTNLSTVEFGDGLQSIGKYVFENCTNLSKVELKEGVESIGRAAFYNCTNLSSVTLNNGLENMSNFVFYNCTSLEEITIPASVKRILNYSFCNCTSLKEVDWLANTVSIENSMFQNCSSLKDVRIADEITGLGDRVFMNCTSLEELTIPASISSLGQSTFENCKNLKEIDFSNSSLNKIGSLTFQGCSSLENFIMPDTVTSMGTGVFNQCSSLKTLQYSHGLTSIVATTTQCAALEEIFLPYGLKTIGDFNFLGGSSLTQVTFPCGLENIGKNNFQFCNKLETLIIPDSVNISEEFDLLAYCYANPKPTIYCKSNSNIKKYADSKGIPCKTDDNAPTLDVNKENMGNGVTRISIIATDDNNIVGLSDYPYSFDGGKTWQPEPYIEISGDNTTITVCARDAVGNIEAENITVIEKALTGIEITHNPDKVAYIEGQDFESKGMTVTAKYSDGTSKEITEFEVIDGNDLTLGKTNVTIIYIENGITKTITQEIRVIEKILTGIEITQNPDKMDYILGQNFESAGMIVTAKYNDGTEKVTTNYTVINGENLRCDRQVEIQYNENHEITTTVSIIVAHMEVVDNAVAPTCTQTGLTQGKHCSVCNKVLVAQEVVEKSAHKEVTDEAVAPTCKETGLTEGKHCSVCNEVLVAQEVVAKLAHTEVTDEAVAPTYTETGLTEGKHCSVCNIVLIAQEVIPALRVVVNTWDISKIKEKDNVAATLFADGELLISGYGNMEDYTYFSIPWSKERGNITNINIENGVTNIGDYIFNGCSKLESITIPKSVANIGAVVFDYCNNLIRITVDGENQKYTSYNGILFNKDKTTIICYPANKEGTRYVIPDSVTKIEERAFRFCKNLTSIEIPETVTNIRHSAFESCSNLKSITIPDSVTTIGNWVFDGCSNLTNINMYCTSTVYGELKEEYLNKISIIHTEVIDSAVAATCTISGKTEGKHCSVCGEIIVAQEIISALGHNYENGICTLCGEEEPKIELESVVYTVTENKIKGISPKITVQEFLSNIETNATTIEVYKGKTRLTDEEFVGTGMTLKLGLNNKKADYTLVVTGDINGDGEVKLSDLSKLKLIIIGKETLEGIYKEAADVTGDENIKLSDLSKMKLYLVGKEIL